MKFKFMVRATFLKARHIEFYALTWVDAKAFEKVLRSFRIGVFKTEILASDQ